MGAASPPTKPADTTQYTGLVHTDADDPDVSGMPPGGTSLPPTTSPGATAPGATSGPATSGPATFGRPSTSGPGDDDKRLHEEPIDNEASNGRTFSDGRPVAGTDPDYR